jgi:hypothetical protein
VSALGHKDVRRLDVAVNNAFCVCGVKCIGNLNRERHHDFCVHRLSCNPVLQRQPVEKLHGDERFAVLGVDLNHRPLGYEPSRAMLTHCDSIGPSASPFQKMPTPTPGFGAKLVPSCKGLAGSLPQHSPKKLPKKSGK